jgi:uroporphyrinogen decarboxylase
MTREECVRAAIQFQSPDRVPVLNLNRDQREGDILSYGMALSRGDLNEWGYHFENLDDGTMGQPSEPVLPDWADLDAFSFPELDPERRMAGAAAFYRESEGWYRLAGLGLTGFTLYMFLRGFENAMLDFVIERDRAEYLLDRIFSFEMDQMRLASEAGFHGVHLADDWGMQSGLIIDPGVWRDLFKPRYRAQCECAHRLGLHLWFHCCGDILEIIPDFHEIGVDVINISQPNVVDIEAAGRAFRGRQCFMLPISYQTVSITGSPEEIHAEARRLYRALGTPEGGFIGYVEEYSCMGMSETNYQACRSAWRALT